VDSGADRIARGKSRQRGGKFAAALQNIAAAHKSADPAENQAARTWDEEAMIRGSNLYTVTDAHHRSMLLELDGHTVAQTFRVAEYLYTNRHVVNDKYKECFVTYYDRDAKKDVRVKWSVGWQFSQIRDEEGNFLDIARSRISGVKGAPAFPTSSWSKKVFDQLEVGSQILAVHRSVTGEGHAEVASTGNVTEEPDPYYCTGTYSTEGNGASGCAVRLGSHVIGIHCGADKPRRLNYFLVFTPDLFPKEFEPSKQYDPTAEKGKESGNARDPKPWLTAVTSGLNIF
jgi:hypothetical protein